MRYAQIDSTGRIICVGEAPDSASLEHFEHVVPEIAADVFADTHYVEEGVCTPFPTKPSLHHTWDWTSKTWIPDLDAARDAQTQAWNIWRDTQFRAGHNGYHCDDTFISELQLVLKGYERGHLAPDQLTAIRKMDNTVVQLTAAQVEALLLEVGLYRQSIYPQSWAGKDALKTLTTLEDILAGGPPT